MNLTREELHAALDQLENAVEDTQSGTVVVVAAFAEHLVSAGRLALAYGLLEHVEGYRPTHT